MLDLLSRKQQPKFSAGNTKVPAAKKIAWLLAEPPEAPIKLICTPEIAGEMLRYNTDNRPIGAGHVSKLANEMKRGEWVPTPIPVIFSDKGRLIDGQHRLSAIVESGIAVEIWVAFGARDESFAYIDTGKKRSGGDVFAINGVPNANAMCAATKWLWVYENQKAATGTGAGAEKFLTNADLYKYYLTIEDLQDARIAYDWWVRNALPCPTGAIAAFYLCARKNRKQAERFFERVSTGVGFESKNDPAYKLREKLTRGEQKPSPRNAVAFIIQAWNAERQNRAVRSFAFDGGPLPRVK